jgi:hypothetical protein
MQDLDSKQWDSRNWHNWLTLFLHDKKIAGTMNALLEDKVAASIEATEEEKTIN